MLNLTRVERGRPGLPSGETPALADPHTSPGSRLTGLELASSLPMGPAVALSAPTRTKKAGRPAYAPRPKAIDVEMAPKGPDAIVSEPGEQKPLPKGGIVTEVYDGDTMTLQDGTKVRVQNVNTPEKRPLEEFAIEAMELTKELALAEKIKLVYDDAAAKDHYGRVAAQVLLPDGSDLALHLIEAGLGHVFIVNGENNPANLEELLAAQERAKKAKRGIWSLPRYAEELNITSFHANGSGDDKKSPNAEYFRAVNISDEVINLKGYTITNKAGREFTLPTIKVRPGHTIIFSSGRGENDSNPMGTARIYLNSKTEVWNNHDELLTIKRPDGSIVIEREHQVEARDYSSMRNPTTQTTIANLGSDVSVTWEHPRKLEVEGKLLVDDGDTIFIPQPATGVFKVTIHDEVHNQDVKRDVRIRDQRESPTGTLAVRFLGVDTPETHVGVKEGDKTVYYSQGKPGEIAGKKLYQLLKKAESVEVLPGKERPFERYSRLLGKVVATMKDGTKVDVNTWLVENGYGEMVQYWHGKDTWDRREFNKLSRASKIAVTHRRGIYGSGQMRCEERPVDFRRRVRGGGVAPPYVADMEKGIVYTGEDIDKVPAYNRLFIFKQDLNDAIRHLKLKRAKGVHVDD